MLGLHEPLSNGATGNAKFFGKVPALRRGAVGQIGHKFSRLQQRGGRSRVLREDWLIGFIPGNRT